VQIDRIADRDDPAFGRWLAEFRAGRRAVST
jgi:hypothetical protein